MAAPVTLDSSGDGARLPIYTTSSCSSELIGLISLCFCAVESVAIIFQAMPLRLASFLGHSHLQFLIACSTLQEIKN